MPSYVIRVDRDRDQYMYWSTIVEAPVFIGNREEMAAKLMQTAPRGYATAKEAEERIRRADETGTSAFGFRSGGKNWPGDGAWNDTSLIYQQQGSLPREKFAEFVDRYLSGDDEPDVSDLLIPFEDDE